MTTTTGFMPSLNDNHQADEEKKDFGEIKIHAIKYI